MNLLLKTICILLILSSIIPVSFAEDSFFHAERDIPDYENHSMLLVKQPSADQIIQLQLGGFDIVEQLPDGGIRIVATAAERDILVTKFNTEVEIENLEDYYRQGLKPLKDMSGYHTYSETFSELFSANLEPIAHMDTIGFSVENRAIPVIKISDNVDMDEDEPKIFINGLIHAREAITVEIVLHFMWYLLDGYNAGDPEIVALVDSTEIWLAPILNPDGYVYNELTNPEGGGMWRKNRRDNGNGTYGVDLNRNWGFLWGYDNLGSSPATSSNLYRGPAPFSEPETQALREFINAHEFAIIINYHSAGALYIKPWGFNRGLYTPDNHIFLYQLDSLAAMNGYDISQSLYITNGGAYDWQYGEQFEKKKAFCYVVEVGPSFWPPDSLIDGLCEENLAGNIFFVREARRLWKRPTRSLATVFTQFDTLLDACQSPDTFTVVANFQNVYSSESIVVHIDYVDSMTSPGWFFVDTSTLIVSPLDSFSVTMHFSHPGDTDIVQTGHLSLFVSKSGEPSTVDTLYFPIHVEISTIGSDINPAFTAEPVVSVPFYPVQFTNNSNVYDSSRWAFGDGFMSTDENPLHAYDSSGSYTVKLVCHSNCYSDSVTYVDYISVGCCVNRGNVDGIIGSGGPVDVTDLSALVDFLFKGGFSPPCEEEGNADGVVGVGGLIDVTDLSYLVEYLFKSGPAPPACL